jgi:hypothetical protein
MNTAHSVADLERTLSLTPSQTARVKTAVDRARQRVEDVLSIPDETGRSPLERREEQRKKVLDALKNKDQSGILTLAVDSIGNRDRQIPGRNATYGQEIERITKETREEIAAGLSEDQRKTFADTRIDPLVAGQGGGGFAFMTGATVEVGEVGEVVVDSPGAASPPPGPSK